MARRILIVEDENEWVSHLREWLLASQPAARVDVASHPDEAINLVQSASYDLAISDYSFPAARPRRGMRLGVPDLLDQHPLAGDLARRRIPTVLVSANI